MKKASNKNRASLMKGEIASKKATEIKQFSQWGWISFKYKLVTRRLEAEGRVRISISVSMNKYRNYQEEKGKREEKVSKRLHTQESRNRSERKRLAEGKEGGKGTCKRQGH